jgi:malonyl-CoA/methylmalonyl-CoA synthetase
VVPSPGATVDRELVLIELKRILANFKVPKRCVIVQELPRNAMGKVQKNVLRAEYTP